MTSDGGMTCGSACVSSFSKLARRSLALRPAHSRCHQFVTRIPKASAISSPPQLLRLLPAGAFAGWDLHPLESAALSRRTPSADIHPGTGLQTPGAATLGLAQFGGSDLRRPFTAPRAARIRLTPEQPTYPGRNALAPAAI